jgi:hypothetical protein
MGDTPLPDPSPPVEPPKPSRRYHFDSLRDYSGRFLPKHILTTYDIDSILYRIPNPGLY